MTVLLTGATGFFGKAALRALHDKGVNVRCIIRKGTMARLGPLNPKDEVLETGDMFKNDHEWWENSCKEIDIVIHAAWYAEPELYLSSNSNIDCLIGTLEMAKGAAAAGVRRFVGIGTCFEYDLSVGHLSVETALDPETLYAATKASAYMALSKYLPPNDVEFLWGRLFYLFGRDENPKRLVPYLHQKLSSGKIAQLSSGRQVRDYMDVDKAAKLLVSETYSGRQGACNICSTVGRTVAEIAYEIADYYDRRDLLSFGSREDNLSDPMVVVGIR